MSGIKFKSGFTYRGTIKANDCIIVWDSDTGIDKYSKISDLPPATGFEPANANIQAHIANSSNPHSTTAAQVGALASGAQAVDSAGLQGHAASYFATASHNHTGVYEPANVNIQSHIGNTSNPHSVTKSQVGLSNVDNTSDDSKSVLYALTAGSASANDVYAWAKNSVKPSYSYSEVGACASGDSRLSDARIASDVYSWAKAASKPSYTYSEVGACSSSDSRLSDSRSANDVYSWAKAASKPSYTKSEIGLDQVDNTADSAKSVSYAATAGNVPALVSTNFTIMQSGSTLIIKYGSNTIVTIDSSGNITANNFIL